MTFRRAVGLAAIMAVCLGLGGCATYSSSLSRAQHAFEQGDHDRALAIFRHLEPDLDRLSTAERVRYAYLRGMNDYRLGDRADARYWLALAQAQDRQSPGALDAPWTERMSASLGDLNEEVLEKADDANTANVDPDEVPLRPLARPPGDGSAGVRSADDAGGS